MNEKQANIDFVKRAKAGDERIYFVGEHLSQADQDVIWPLRDAYNAGWIDFKQARARQEADSRAKSKFVYIAQKRARKSPPRPAFAHDRPNVAVHLFHEGNYG